VKAAALEGDPDIKNLVAVSIYDSQPANFLSTVLKDIKWEMNGKTIFNLTCFKAYETHFLRTNFQNI